MLQRWERTSVAHYDVFGYAVESDIELPDLPATQREGAPAWRVETVVGPTAGTTRSLLGTETVYGTVQVKAYAADGGLRLTFDDTGTFDVRLRDRVIAWHPGPSATDAAVRADLLGRVMALAAHADGLLSLHASAVSIAGRAIGFLGPKHAGKSTLALAMVRHGATLVTDDALVLRTRGGDTAWAAPGVQRLRLWNDSARALGAPPSPDTGAKPTIDRLTSAELESSEVPLAACYVLERADEHASDAIRRERMSSVHAAVACVRFAKLGALAGGAVGAAVLDRAVRLTRAVPVFAAHIRRDLAQLDDVAATIADWHAADSSADAEAVR